MAESMHARIPVRHPANRRPRIPHPHLAPQPAQKAQAAPELDGVPAAMASDISDTQDETAWTPAAVPMARPAGRPRRGSGPGLRRRGRCAPCSTSGFS